MKFRLSDLEKTRAQLQAVLEADPSQVPPRGLSAMDLVRLLAPEITNTVAKGYTLDHIATFLAEHGLALRPATFRRYLRLVKQERKRAARRTTSRPSPEFLRATPVEESSAENRHDDGPVTEPAPVESPTSPGHWSEPPRDPQLDQPNVACCTDVGPAADASAVETLPQAGLWARLVKFLLSPFVRSTTATSLDRFAMRGARPPEQQG